MKPREIINRKKHVYLAIVGISFAALALLAFIEKYLQKSLFNTLALGSGTIFVMAVLLVYWGIRCPGCGKILGLKFVYAEETLKRCPRCGIHFDEDSL